ncbi:MAG: crossover junction endodeoxyribonuclease RuvC [Oscillospiraceae bacterium]|nr:crossover junction endodeoxyribonuclease RuvC [Oscillospiraceae bacterium]
MIILGIDPGLATVGYGVLKFERNKFTTINYGVIITPPKTPVHERLKTIYDEIKNLIDMYKPDDLAIEELFYNTNQKTIISVCEARGVVLLCAYQNRLDIGEYTPLQVKQSVVGYGRADKIQVQTMVKNILNLEKMPKPDDAADALAIGICHAHSKSTNSLFNILNAKI